MAENEKQLLLPNDHSFRNYYKSAPLNNTKPRKQSISLCEKRQRQKGLKKYYDYQKRLLSLYEEDKGVLNNSCTLKQLKLNSEEAEKRRKKDGHLAAFSFAFNIVLLFLNLTASILSGSLSIISAFIDTAMDITSGVLIYTSVWAIKNTNMFNYPRGRNRLELVAILACSVIMSVANIMMIIQSVQGIINKTINPEVTFITFAVIIGGCLPKIILLIVCHKHGSPNSRTIALDLRNDLLTSMFALTGAYIGANYWLYADPIAAICVCTIIAGSWFNNALCNIPMMVGRRAQQENISRIMRICIEHDSHVKCLDHLMVYHTGSEAIVEVHVVLDEQLPLKMTHDITESLTKKLTALPFVERTFVHCDYKCDGDED